MIVHLCEEILHLCSQNQSWKRNLHLVKSAWNLNDTNLTLIIRFNFSSRHSLPDWGPLKYMSIYIYIQNSIYIHILYMYMVPPCNTIPQSVETKIEQLGVPLYIYILIYLYICLYRLLYIIHIYTICIYPEPLLSAKITYNGYSNMYWNTLGNMKSKTEDVRSSVFLISNLCAAPKAFVPSAWSNST